MNSGLFLSDATPDMALSEFCVMTCLICLSGSDLVTGAVIPCSELNIFIFSAGCAK